MTTEKILIGDCRNILDTLEPESIQCVVTSPPYFGLRDYGIKGQFGHESTPDEYVNGLVSIFRLMWPALRKDGTVWLNLGDSYVNNPGNGRGGESKVNGGIPHRSGVNKTGLPGLKTKDLIGIPWRVALALQADGWWLRQDIIWNKPNPMTESVKDRCTKAHEYIFLLTKSARYYFDHKAIQEPVAKSTVARLSQNIRDQIGSSRIPGKTNGNMKAVGNTDLRNRRSVWTVTTKPNKLAHFATFPPELITPCILAGSRPGDVVLDPFGGSGTTAAVAKKHGRGYVSIELNPNYADLHTQRIAAIAGAV